MIDDKEFDTVSQLSHFGWGLAVVFGPAALLRGFWYLWFALLWIAYSAGKEFYWDEVYESAEVRGSSAKDFAFQVGGAALAVLLVVLFR